ncbi:MAG: pyridoxal phosphate-dependent aminotransferase [Candidatus Aenigmarchaeota archaeon]|nr:pyridoxal phosphate-dependent aminotransferase [Candidatus Aenigmarchaeota archaeon]
MFGKKYSISERFLNLPSSIFAKIMKIASEDKSVISLGPGEPDFTTPKHIIKYAKKKLSEGYTHYSAPDGRDELKEAIVKKVRKENKIKASSDEVIVTCGSQEALFLGVLSLIDPGEKVLVPDPGFLAYIPMIETINGVPVSVPLLEDEGFEFNPDTVKKLIDKRTRILLINTPSNPTGRVLKKKTLEELADIAIDNNLIIFSDEAYENIIYDNQKHISIGSLNGMKNHVISLFTFSKTQAMAGWRLGYAVGPKDIIQSMVKMHIYTTVCAPTIAQIAGYKALTSKQDYIEKMRKEYDRRRKLIIKRLEEIPRISCLKPEGAFYAFPNIKELGMSSIKVSDFFLKKAKVLTVPGTEFGKYGEGYIRLSYATEYKKIEEALDRIEKAIRSLK